jgi:hypothetical protein
LGVFKAVRSNPRPNKGLRNRARMTLIEEAALLAPYLDSARQGDHYCAAAESQARKSLGAIHGAIYGVCNIASPWLAQAGT